VIPLVSAASSCCIFQIPALLEDGRTEMRTMGAELLCVTTRVQGEGDNKLDALQDNTPLVRVRQLQTQAAT
jgi:hypothetical protein